MNTVADPRAARRSAFLGTSLIVLRTPGILTAEATAAAAALFLEFLAG